MRKILIIAILIAILAIAGVYYLTTRQPAIPAKLEAKINIENFKFVPDSIKIEAGTDVVWTNKDVDLHKIASDQSQPNFLVDLNSNELGRSEIYGYVFNKPGTYYYYCRLHPEMKGIIIVE